MSPPKQACQKCTDTMRHTLGIAIFVERQVVHKHQKMYLKNLRAEGHGKAPVLTHNALDGRELLRLI